MSKYLRPYGFTRDVTLLPNTLVRFPGLGSTPKLVWGALARMSSGKNYAFPSIETVAADLGCSRDAVISSLRDLVGQGFLERKRRGQGQTNLYYFLNHPVFADWITDAADEAPTVSGETPPASTFQELEKPTSTNRESRPQKLEKPTSTNRESRPISVESNYRAELSNRISPNISTGQKQTRPTTSPSDEELGVLRRHIEAFGVGVPDDALLRATLKAGQGATAYQVAAYLHDRLRFVHRKPELQPTSMGWFPDVVRNHFLKKRGMQRAGDDPLMRKLAKRR